VVRQDVSERRFETVVEKDIFKHVSKSASWSITARYASAKARTFRCISWDNVIESNLGLQYSNLTYTFASLLARTCERMWETAPLLYLLSTSALMNATTAAVSAATRRVAVDLLALSSDQPKFLTL